MEAAAAQKYEFVRFVFGYGEGRYEEEGRCLLSESGVFASDGGCVGRFVGGGGIGYLMIFVESCNHVVIG